MSKIFRLYPNGTNTYRDWQSTAQFPYNSTARDQIENPDGAAARTEITSIPSPFARIALVKTAFQEVCKSGLEGHTIFHKMVSHSLDVGELFFNFDKYSHDFEIIAWDTHARIEELCRSPHPGHTYLGNVLKTYLAADSRTFNFEKLRTIYLLNDKRGEDMMNIVGATSPATLFVSTANDFSAVGHRPCFGQHKPFGQSDFLPLYKRDFEYVKYWFYLRNRHASFATHFPEVNEYLDVTFQKITDSQREELRSFLQESNTLPQQYAAIQFGFDGGSYQVEVLGELLYKTAPKPITQSDFFIQPTRPQAPGSRLPLVLPVEDGNTYARLQYTYGTWGDKQKAPYVDRESDLNKRLLPFDNTPHPYLTISDFLEDTLIERDRVWERDAFFDGNLTDMNEGKAYLLPLKPLYFDYFTPETLTEGFPGGVKAIEMEWLAGGSGVTVTLRIPIHGNGQVRYMEYSRKYYKNRPADISAQKNEGDIQTCDFSGFLMPNLRFADPSQAVYRIGCLYEKANTVEMTFYNGRQALTEVAVDHRNIIQSEAYLIKTYSLEKQHFEYIQVRLPHTLATGVILPRFRQQQSIDSYDFAIDLGTTNTHIEYRKNGKADSQPFDYSSADSPISHFFRPEMRATGEGMSIIDGKDSLERQRIQQSYLPDTVGEGDFRFPMRTVLAHDKTMDWTKAYRPLATGNIPMTYNKLHTPKYDQTDYNIKWGDTAQTRMMEAYIDTLMLMLRNKVVMNNGNLAGSTVRWFYPLSMTPHQRSRMRQAWDSAFQRYFTDRASTLEMTESEAPIQYYFHTNATAKEIVNVDIGGGTTDIAFANGQEITQVTSFRFASNSLFSDAFTTTQLYNGIVNHYSNKLKQIVTFLPQIHENDKKYREELKYVFEAEDNRNTANMASLLFSLKELSVLRELNPKEIDFHELLAQDAHFKIVFVLFYTAIIYHIAQIIRVTDTPLPRHISFSGNGSKVVTILTGDVHILAEYTKLILQTVSGKTYGPNESLELLGLDAKAQPKESTCKGGLLAAADVQSKSIHGKNIILKSSGDALINRNDTFAKIKDNPAYMEQSIAAVERFLDVTFDTFNSEFSFHNAFGCSRESIDIARALCKKDLRTYLTKGLEQLCQQSGDNETVNETLFFYPIKGVLQAVSTEIDKSLSPSAE